jgi:hypothetical protein
MDRPRDDHSKSRGREYFTFVNIDGTIWTEFDRAK